MKQVKAFGPQDLRVVDSPIPTPADGEVLIKVKACGICGSDKWFWYVKEPADYVAGHEVAGEVIKVGAGVTELKVGDRVAINNVKGCGKCPACLDGNYVRCPNGVTHMGYGFSEYVSAPENNCLVLDQSVSELVGSLIFDNWGTPYSALQLTSMGEGDTVVVMGAGPIGLAAIKLSTLRGARVLAIDPNPDRLIMAKEQGATWVATPDETVSSIIDSFDADGFDYIVECSGKSTAYEKGNQLVKVGGVIVCIGEGAALPFVSSDIIHKHLTLVGSLYSSMSAGHAVQQLIIDGQIDPVSIVTHTFSLEELPKKFDQVIHQKDGLVKSAVVIS